MDITEKYRQIKYVEGGKDFDGCDCFGLICLFYDQELGVNLPHYTNYKKIAEAYRKVDSASVRKDDILLFERNGQQHAGVALSKYKFMHCVSSQGVLISNIASWRRRLTGVYRRKGE